MKIPVIELLANAELDIENISKTVEAEFKVLKKEQLNWKPDTHKWSILECLEHLHLVNQPYFEQMLKGIEKSRHKPVDIFSTGFWGLFMTERVRPTEDKQIRMRMKTFKATTPEIGHADPEEVYARFQSDRGTWKEIIAKSKDVNINKIKITSLVGNALRFKLGDAIRFLIAHEQRHILQAQNVLAKMPFI